MKNPNDIGTFYSTRICTLHHLHLMRKKYAWWVLQLLILCRLSAPSAAPDQNTITTCSWDEDDSQSKHQQALIALQQRLSILEARVASSSVPSSVSSPPDDGAPSPPPPFLYQHRTLLSDILQLRASWTGVHNVTSISFARRRAWAPHLALVGNAGGGIGMLQLNEFATYQQFPSIGMFAYHDLCHV